MSDDEDSYIVELVLKRRKKRGRNEYLVKWQGFPNSDNTWEPVENLFACSQLIREFEDREKNAKSRHAKKSLPKSGGRSKLKKEVDSDDDEPRTSTSGTKNDGGASDPEVRSCSPHPSSHSDQQSSSPSVLVQVQSDLANTRESPDAVTLIRSETIPQTSAHINEDGPQDTVDASDKLSEKPTEFVEDQLSDQPMSAVDSNGMEQDRTVSLSDDDDTTVESRDKENLAAETPVTPSTTAIDATPTDAETTTSTSDDTLASTTKTAEVTATPSETSTSMDTASAETVTPTTTATTSAATVATTTTSAETVTTTTSTSAATVTTVATSAETIATATPVDLATSSTMPTTPPSSPSAPSAQVPIHTLITKSFYRNFNEVSQKDHEAQPDAPSVKARLVQALSALQNTVAGNTVQHDEIYLEDWVSRETVVTLDQSDEETDNRKRARTHVLPVTELNAQDDASVFLAAILAKESPRQVERACTRLLTELVVQIGNQVDGLDELVEDVELLSFNSLESAILPAMDEKSNNAQEDEDDDDEIQFLITSPAHTPAEKHMDWETHVISDSEDMIMDARVHSVDGDDEIVAISPEPERTTGTKIIPTEPVETREIVRTPTSSPSKAKPAPKQIVTIDLDDEDDVPATTAPAATVVPKQEVVDEACMQSQVKDKPVKRKASTPETSESGSLTVRTKPSGAVKIVAGIGTTAAGGNEAKKQRVLSVQHGEYWVLNKCKVCHTKLFNESSWNQHVASIGHWQKHYTYKFMADHSASLEPSTSTDQSQSMEIIQKSNVKYIGQECIHEIHHAGTLQLWICSVCNSTCKQLSNLVDHLNSSMHRMAYIIEYHPSFKPKGKTPKEVTQELTVSTMKLHEQNKGMTSEVLVLNPDDKQALAALESLMDPVKCVPAPDSSKANNQILPRSPIFDALKGEDFVRVTIVREDDVAVIFCEICLIHVAISKPSINSVQQAWMEHKDGKAHKGCYKFRLTHTKFDPELYLAVDHPDPDPQYLRILKARTELDMKNKFEFVVGLDFIVQRYACGLSDTQRKYSWICELCCLTLHHSFAVLRNHLLKESHVVHYMHARHGDRFLEWGYEPKSESGTRKAICKIMNSLTYSSRTNAKGKSRVYDPNLVRLLRNEAFKYADFNCSPAQYKSLEKSPDAVKFAFNLLSLMGDLSVPQLSNTKWTLDAASIPVLSDYVAKAKRPLLGMKKVVMFPVQDEDGEPSSGHLYICRLCLTLETDCSLIGHITSDEHVQQFIDRFYQKAYGVALQGARSADVRKAALDQYTKEIADDLRNAWDKPGLSPEAREQLAKVNALTRLQGKTAKSVPASKIKLNFPKFKLIVKAYQNKQAKDAAKTKSSEKAPSSSGQNAPSKQTSSSSTSNNNNSSKRPASRTSAGSSSQSAIGINKNIRNNKPPPCSVPPPLIMPANVMRGPPPRMPMAVSSGYSCPPPGVDHYQMSMPVMSRPPPPVLVSTPARIDPPPGISQNDWDSKAQSFLAKIGGDLSTFGKSSGHNEPPAPGDDQTRRPPPVSKSSSKATSSKSRDRKSRSPADRKAPHLKHAPRCECRDCVHEKQKRISKDTSPRRRGSGRRTTRSRSRTRSPRSRRPSSRDISPLRTTSGVLYSNKRQRTRSPSRRSTRSRSPSRHRRRRSRTRSPAHRRRRVSRSRSRSRSRTRSPGRRTTRSPSTSSHQSSSRPQPHTTGSMMSTLDRELARARNQPTSKELEMLQALAQMEQQQQQPAFASTFTPVGTVDSNLPWSTNQLDRGMPTTSVTNADEDNMLLKLLIDERKRQKEEEDRSTELMNVLSQLAGASSSSSARDIASSLTSISKASQLSSFLNGSSSDQFGLTSSIASQPYGYGPTSTQSSLTAAQTAPGYGRQYYQQAGTQPASSSQRSAYLGDLSRMSEEELLAAIASATGNAASSDNQFAGSVSRQAAHSDYRHDGPSRSSADLAALADFLAKTAPDRDRGQRQTSMDLTMDSPLVPLPGVSTSVSKSSSSRRRRRSGSRGRTTTNKESNDNQPFPASFVSGSSNNQSRWVSYYNPDVATGQTSEYGRSYGAAGTTRGTASFSQPQPDIDPVTGQPTWSNWFK